MNLQYAFLLTFIAGGISVWICIAMSRRVYRRRMEIIKQQIKSIGGNTLSIDLIDRNNCPFSREYEDPDLVYKFYKISYQSDHQIKEGWAILEMKQNRYGPSGAIKENWIWRID